MVREIRVKLNSDFDPREPIPEESKSLEMEDIPFLLLHPVSEPTGSPAEFLWRDLGLALLAMDEAVKRRLSRSDKRFTIRLVAGYTGRPFIAHLKNETSEIEISREFLSLLWVCSYLNFIYWEVSQGCGAIGRAVDIHLAEHPRLLEGIEALYWALKVQPGDRWPVGLPQPRDDDREGSDGHIATQIALRAAALLVLHEIAHGLLGHEGRKKRQLLENRDDEKRLRTEENYISIQQERDADREAFDLYFEGVDRDSGEFSVKGLGAMTLIYMSMGRELFHPMQPGTHPPGWQRLEDLISQLDLPEDDFLLLFASHLKSLYLAISGHLSGGTAASPRESLGDLFEQLSRDNLE
jgi:hypothetical protein